MLKKCFLVRMDMNFDQRVVASLVIKIELTNFLFWKENAPDSRVIFLRFFPFQN